MRNSEDITQLVASKIKILRTGFKPYGLSQEELADKLDVKTNTISRWETGVYKPKLKDLDRLAQFFNVPLSEFFSENSSISTNYSEPVNALMRAAKELPAEDVEVLRQFAEIKSAQIKLRKSKSKS
jgi:transcriptional regulator with XRE-family HTH domain